MRINTVNEKYIMIKSEEVSNVALNSNKISVEKADFSIKAYKALKTYYFKHNDIPSEIAVSTDSEISKLLLEDIDDKISIIDIHNSFMYAVMTDDVDKINSLGILLRCHHKVKYDDVTKELSSYIRENKDYDYIDNVNRVNRKDSSILLFDGEKLQIINLLDSELVLQNKSVNQ